MTGRSVFSTHMALLMPFADPPQPRLCIHQFHSHDPSYQVYILGTVVELAKIAAVTQKGRMNHADAHYLYILKGPKLPQAFPVLHACSTAA